MKMMKVLAISGSLRRESHNTTLLRAAAELLPPPVGLEIFDGLKAVEPYDEDDDKGAGPAGARRLRDAIQSADAVLIATPQYNSSVPGQLKNAIDWASRPPGTTPSGASPSRSSAPAPAPSARSGLRPRSARPSARAGRG